LIFFFFVFNLLKRNLVKKRIFPSMFIKSIKPGKTEFRKSHLYFVKMKINYKKKKNKLSIKNQKNNYNALMFNFQKLHKNQELTVCLEISYGPPAKWQQCYKILSLYVALKSVTPKIVEYFSSQQSMFFQCKSANVCLLIIQR